MPEQSLGCVNMHYSGVGPLSCVSGCGCAGAKGGVLYCNPMVDAMIYYNYVFNVGAHSCKPHGYSPCQYTKNAT